MRNCRSPWHGRDNNVEKTINGPPVIRTSCELTGTKSAPRSSAAHPLRLGVVGPKLFKSALAAIEAIQRGWGLLPAPTRSFLRRTGLPYAGNYLASYRQMHSHERFAGNLSPIQERRPESGRAESTSNLEPALNDIFDSIVLPNGVRKTTAPGRLRQTLNSFLSRPERPVENSCLRVLDLPSSSGVASVDSYNLLRSHYDIKSYVLADLCLEVQYDPKRKCIYDPDGNLLQVQGNKFFFSIYRPHTSGSAPTILSHLLLWPIALRARQLKRKYVIDKRRTLATIRLLHPEAERLVSRGIFTVRNADIFSVPWFREFDLVLSFNLLQKSYFSKPRIAKGLQNLARALTEGGYLITGNTESFGVMRKTRGVLTMQYQQGEW